MNLAEENKCTGCGVCYAVCHKNAISFKIDELGFRYPVIDNSKCVDCGHCTKICPELNPANFENKNDCYIAWANDDNVHYESSSGGVATILAKHIIKQGGFVIGCVWDEQFNAVFKIIETEDELWKIQGSKYVKSYFPEKLWQEIKDKTNIGKYGLFVGLPCQTAALKKYVKKANSLILCDLLCRGGNSPECLKQHLGYVESKQNISQITNIKFRGGKNDCNFTLWNNNELVYKDGQYSDSYFYSFMKHGLLQETCYSCQYAKQNRVSDLTLADFWGISPDFIKDKNVLNGTNLVIVHTVKGEKIWNDISNEITKYKRDIDEAVASNDTLREPTVPPSDREQIVESVKNIGFEKTVLKDKVFLQHKRAYKRGKIVSKIKNAIPAPLFRLLKKIKSKL